ncbi:unnamed protein product, partial [marine sediment metagenome]
GRVIEGESYVNESMLTGESKPVAKKISDQVTGGAVNGEGVLKVKIERTGGDSYLSKVIELVRKAQKDKSKNQLLADKASKWLSVISISFGFITLITWWFFVT